MRHPVRFGDELENSDNIFLLPVVIVWITDSLLAELNEPHVRTSG